MNDFAVIVIPVWCYWFFVVWLAVDAVRTTVGLVNQYLTWKLEKKHD